MLFILFALFSVSSALIVPLSTFTGEETLYRVNKTHKVYVISDSPQQLLQSLTITTGNGAQNSNGFTLSTPSNDGSVTPFVPAQDNDLVSVVFNGATPLNGWFYINSVTPNINVFPLFENKTLNFKLGTNLFFKMSNPAGKIPVAQNVVIGKNQPLNGFVGLPDETTPVQFFNSDFIGVSTYNQLELPLGRFHFTSNSADAKYEITYSQRQGMAIGSSGLVMTDSFPTGTYGTNNYDLNNQNGVNVDGRMMANFDKTRQFYSGNVTVFMTPTTVPETIFPLLSNADTTNITSNSPMSRIVVESDGPYAIQYYLRDTTATTPSPFETTTKSSSFAQIIVSLLVVSIFRF